MQDAKVRAALIAICLACLLGSGAVLVMGHRAEPPPIVITPPPAQVSVPPPVLAKADTPLAAARIYVDVAGAVRRPSLYALPPGSRVMQAVVAAGGPTSGADLDAVNLAQKLTDGEKVYVPKRGLATSAPLLSAPDHPPLSAVTLPRQPLAKPISANRSSKLTADSGQQIALNTATAEELEQLPGVGPAMASRILAYRTQAGSFGKIEDLMQVTGIGPKKFAKIAPFVKLN